MTRKPLEFFFVYYKFKDMFLTLSTATTAPQTYQNPYRAEERIIWQYHIKAFVYGGWTGIACNTKLPAWEGPSLIRSSLLFLISHRVFTILPIPSLLFSYVNIKKEKHCFLYCSLLSSLLFSLFISMRALTKVFVNFTWNRFQVFSII